jgi:hypothetical protein
LDRPFNFVVAGARNRLLRSPGSLGWLLGFYPRGNPGIRRGAALTAPPLPEDPRRLLE